MKRKEGASVSAAAFSDRGLCPFCGKKTCRGELVPVEELRARGWVEVSPGLFVPPGDDRGSGAAFDVGGDK